MTIEFSELAKNQLSSHRGKAFAKRFAKVPKELTVVPKLLHALLGFAVELSEPDLFTFRGIFCDQEGVPSVLLPASGADLTQNMHAGAGDGYGL